MIQKGFIDNLVLANLNQIPWGYLYFSLDQQRPRKS